jgi:ArsR family transcriptional regulator, arsenate/arsenite/antimonite-responsive transcriptional repressor
MGSQHSRLSPCCPPLLKGELKREDAKELAATFKAVADPARLLVLSLIAAQPTGEACVCHFTARLDLSQPTVSHHLKRLFDAGLLARERRGTWVYYRIIPERLTALRKVLSVTDEATTDAQPRRKRRA